jgi:hypothetical protein
VSVVTEPFPHMVVDDAWHPDLLARVLGEFPPDDDQRWRQFDNAEESKLEGGEHLWGPATHELFAAVEGLIPALEHAFGIPGLSMELVGGGYHVIPVGGYLAVHTDFNRSPVTGLHRRLNLLVYLNEDWKPDDGGQLELWDDDGPSVSIAPEFNRTAVFATSDRSWHGHPEPTKRIRRSVAAYFYTAEAPDGYEGEHSTVWHPRGQVRA